MLLLSKSNGSELNVNLLLRKYNGSDLQPMLSVRVLKPGTVNPRLYVFFPGTRKSFRLVCVRARMVLVRSQS